MPATSKMELFDNSLLLKAVNKILIVDTSRGLDLTVVKYDFPVTVKGCLADRWLFN